MQQYIHLWSGSIHKDLSTQDHNPDPQGNFFLSCSHFGSDLVSAPDGLYFGDFFCWVLGIGQPCSSDWSVQSKCPLHLADRSTHSLLAQWNIP